MVSIASNRQSKGNASCFNLANHYFFHCLPRKISTITTESVGESRQEFCIGYICSAEAGKEEAWEIKVFTVGKICSTNADKSIIKTKSVEK
jgi:hypothetical protein